MYISFWMDKRYKYRASFTHVYFCKRIADTYHESVQKSETQPSVHARTSTHAWIFYADRFDESLLD